ncbi:hypothetical protein AVEN_82608-1 [Araneus ventricosus]|uniref:Uncharacterized protein n=1 Tax=Araneus ventricosus TaxID=182803 RepID=A0A4Y2VQX9_ARAVE|nr:hypothetical protein AVEN_82608-1 [Araneus ventricosus]
MIWGRKIVQAAFPEKTRARLKKFERLHRYRVKRDPSHRHVLMPVQLGSSNCNGCMAGVDRRSVTGLQIQGRGRKSIASLSKSGSSSSSTSTRSLRKLLLFSFVWSRHCEQQGLFGRMRHELNSPNLGGHLPCHLTPCYNLPLRCTKMGCDGQGLSDPLLRLSPKRFQNLTSRQKKPTASGRLSSMLIPNN